MLRKPARWAWTPGLADPRWGWFNKNAVFMLPMWEGGGDPRAVIPGSMPLVNTNLWGVNELGPTMSGSVGGSLRLSFPLIERMKVVRPFSIVIGMTWTTTANQIIAETNGNLGWSVQTDSGPSLYCNVNRASGENKRINLNSPPNDGLPHLIIFSAHGSDQNLDLAFADSVENTGAIMLGLRQPDYGAATDIDIFSRGGVADFEEDIWFLAVLRDFAIQQPQATQLQDRFGPLRMVDEVGTVVGLQVGGDITRNVSPVSATFTAVSPFVTIKRILVPVTAVFTSIKPIITIKRLVSPTVSTFIAKTPKVTIKRLVSSVTTTFTSITPTTIRSISVDSTIATFTAVTPIISITRLVEPVIATFIAKRPTRIGGTPPAPSGKRYPPLLKYPGRGMDR